MKKISLSQPFSATFLVLALLFMGLFLVPFGSAAWYNPFSWGTDGIVEKENGRWIEIFNDNPDFYSVIPNNSKHDADIYLCSKTSTKKNDLKDLDFATSFNKEQKELQTKAKLKPIEYNGANCYYYKPAKDEKYLKFGEHSTHFIYTSESITAYEDTAFFNDNYVEIGTLSLSTEGYDYKNGKPNIERYKGKDYLTHTFYIENYSNNAITNLRTVDLNNNGIEVERNANLKFLSYVEVEVENNIYNCENIVNSTGTFEFCQFIPNGTKIVTQEQWNNMSLAVEGENYIIGVFADTSYYDYIDIDFDYYGISVLESPIDWATWVVIGADVTDAHGNSLTQGADSVNNAYGMLIKTNKNVTLKEVTTTTGATPPTNAILYWLNNTVIINATITGGVATFPANTILYANTFYWIRADKSGSLYTRYYDTTVVGYPEVDTNINWISSGTPPGANESTVAYMIISVKTAEVEETFDTKPQVTLTSPANNSNLTSSLQDFVGVVTDNLYVTNVSLKIDGAIVETDTSHTNGTYTFDAITITEGRHNWSILAYDNASQSNESAVWYFNYTQPPIYIIQENPTDLSTSQVPSVNVSCYAYESKGITQLNLTINNVVRQTVVNSSQSQNLSIKNISNYSEGQFNWSCSAKNLETSASSSNRTFNVNYSYPSVTLNSPINTYNSTISLMTFNTTVSDLNGVQNVSLYIDGVLDQTNSTGGNKTYILTKSVSDGNHNWSIRSVSTLGKITNSETRTFSIDANPPTFIVNSGSGNQNYGKVGNNHTINITTTDTNLNTCWYNYNSTNTTFSCTTGVLNSVPLTLYQAINLVTFYANDSNGNVNSTSASWDYKVFEITDYYTTSTVSGAINPFNITANSSEQITVAYLNYNGTNYLASISSPVNPFVLSKNIVAPAVTLSTNIPFYWNLTTSSGFSVLTSSQNQTVKEAAIINTTCTGMYYLYNISIADEITQAILNGTTQNTSIKIDLNLYTSDKTLNLLSYYIESSKINPTSLCISNNLSDGEIYSLDMQIQYQASDYSTEFYNIEDRTLNAASLNSTITFYDLPTANAQKFRLLVRDTAYLPREGALIQVERKYLENGTFYISEIPKTDAKGITSASLEVDDVIYNFYIYDGGVLVDSFTNVLAICQTPLVSTCEIDFNSFQTGIEIPDYEEGIDFSYTLGYNSTSRVVSTSFSIPSGDPSAIQLVVIREDTLGTSVCSDTLTSSSGTLSCVVPSSFGNSTVLAKLYKGGVEQARGNIKIDQRSSEIYGVILVVLSLMVMMTLIGLAISDNPVISAVFLFVGVVLIYGMNLVQNTGFVGATATILFLAIAIILIIVKAGRRN